MTGTPSLPPLGEKSKFPKAFSATVTLPPQQRACRNLDIVFNTRLVASTPPSKEASGAHALALDNDGESLSQTAPLPSEEPCGLTPASLKHLRRQRDALNEEKNRLQAELQESTKQLKELKPQVASLSTQLEEAIASRAELETQVESNRQRAERSEELSAKLEAVVAEKEAEIERLRKGLADQQKLTQEVCEAADRRDQQANEQNAAQVRDLQETIRKLKMENQQLLQEQQLQAKRQEEMAHSVAVAMAAAEKAMAMHAQHTSQLETLRTAKLAEAINSKVELHIAVPKVTLSQPGMALQWDLAFGLQFTSLRCVECRTHIVYWPVGKPTVGWSSSERCSQDQGIHFACSPSLHQSADSGPCDGPD
ncbi:unnamed protein product [Symbiodinium sp. CCMP2456]|nr:unnamed protein product [Symbiodinium sp. CCMP2456]